MRIRESMVTQLYTQLSIYVSSRYTAKVRCWQLQEMRKLQVLGRQELLLLMDPVLVKTQFNWLLIITWVRCSYGSRKNIQIDSESSTTITSSEIEMACLLNEEWNSDEHTFSKSTPKPPRAYAQQSRVIIAATSTVEKSYSVSSRRERSRS